MPARGRASAWSEGHPFDLRPGGHRSRDSRGKFRSEKWDFSTRNLLLAPRRSALRNKVREPAGSPTPFGEGLPGLSGCSFVERPQTECRLGKGFALPLAPIPVRQPAGFPTPFRGRLARSWWAQLIGAAAGRVQIGESFTLPLPPLESGAAAAAPDTPWGRAYPVLDCAGVECGRIPSAVRSEPGGRAFEL